MYEPDNDGHGLPFCKIIIVRYARQYVATRAASGPLGRTPRPAPPYDADSPNPGKGLSRMTLTP
jgi:hypothetical protein